VVKRVLCLLALFSILFSQKAELFSDTIHTNDNNIIKGVIIKHDESYVMVSTENGEITLQNTHIKKIDPGSEEENLLYLAKVARIQGDLPKADYLYQKILKANPDSKEALDALKKIINKTKKSQTDQRWSTEYEHYQRKNAKSISDKEALSENSQSTEELRRRWGIILAPEAGRTKIEYVDNSSKAKKAGFEADDCIININGKPAEYMGAFDIATEFLQKDRVTVTIQREIQFWTNEIEQTESAVSKRKRSFYINNKSNEIFVRNLTQGAEIYQSGLRTNDQVVAINSNNPIWAQLMSILDQRTPGYTTFLIRRELEVG